VCTWKMRSLGAAVFALAFAPAGPVDAQGTQPSSKAGCAPYEQQMSDALIAISATRQQIAAEQNALAIAQQPVPQKQTAIRRPMKYNRR